MGCLSERVGILFASFWTYNGAECVNETQIGVGEGRAASKARMMMDDAGKQYKHLNGSLGRCSEQSGSFDRGAMGPSFGGDIDEKLL